MQIKITEKQKQQFNLMLDTLKKIRDYKSSKKIRKDSHEVTPQSLCDWGSDFEEALEMAYNNIQSKAALACKNVKPIT